MTEKIQASIGVLMGAAWGAFVGMAYHNVLRIAAAFRDSRFIRDSVTARC